MRREPNYLLLGITVAVLLALFFGVLIFVAGGMTWGRSYQTVTVRFEHDMALPRLKTGAEVECGGTLVGTVEAVGLESVKVEPDDARAQLFLVAELRVDESIELRKDCRIRAEAPPLGGVGKIVIVHRGHDPQRLAEDDVVDGLPPAGLGAVVGTLGEQLGRELDEHNPEGLLYKVKSQLDPNAPQALMAKIHAIADDLIATAGQVRMQLDPAEQAALLGKLDAALADVKAITGTLRGEANAADPTAMLGRLHAVLAALGEGSRTAAAMLDESRPAIRATLENVQGTAATIRTGMVPQVMAQLDTSQPESLMSKMQQAADRTNASLQNLQDMTGSARNLLTVNQGSIEATLANLLETSDHLRAASREIRRNPWRLLYRPNATELKQARLAEAARSFSDAAGRLDNTFERIGAYVRAAGPALAADDPQLRQMQEQLNLSLQNLTQAEKRFWELFAAN